MELKSFVQQVISEIIEAVDASSNNASRSVTLVSRPDRRTVEFDVAVSAEEKTKTKGEAGIHVLAFMEAGANVGVESSNSTVSRIKFGVDIGTRTKEELASQKTFLEARRPNGVNPAK